MENLEIIWFQPLLWAGTPSTRNTATMCAATAQGRRLSEGAEALQLREDETSPVLLFYPP